jgi:hypothetical protein
VGRGEELAAARGQDRNNPGKARWRPGRGAHWQRGRPQAAGPCGPQRWLLEELQATSMVGSGEASSLVLHVLATLPVACPELATQGQIHNKRFNVCCELCFGCSI